MYVSNFQTKKNKDRMNECAHVVYIINSLFVILKDFFGLLGVLKLAIRRSVSMECIMYLKCGYLGLRSKMPLKISELRKPEVEYDFNK